MRGPNYDWTHAVTWAMSQSSKRRNVYFTPVTHRPATEGYRSKKTAYELPGLFADVDFKGVGKEAVIAQLEASGSGDRVTAVVQSGGRFHPYSKFEKPVMVDDVGRERL